MERQTIYLGIAVTGLLFMSVAGAAQQEPLFSDDARVMTAQVEEVLSTDLIRLATGERVRLIGIRSIGLPPRTRVERDGHGFVIEDENPVVSLEEQALRFVRQCIEGNEVRLEFDRQRYEGGQVLLAYVFLPDGTLLNAEILRQGFATLSLGSPDLKWAEALREAYREARLEQRGVHGE